MLLPIDFIVCIFGWLLYNVFALRNAKNKYDEIDKEFNLKHYTTLSWDDWIFTFLASFGLLMVSPTVFLYLTSTFDILANIYWSEVIPFFIGAFGGLIFQKIYDFVKAYQIKK
jgi:hypothetical protein